MKFNRQKNTAVLVFYVMAGLFSPIHPLDFGTKVGRLFEPYLEWQIDNVSYSGNPHDVIAHVAFSHQGSSENRTTEMFYDGNDTYRFRFSGTQTGTWTFSTSSSNSDLDGHTGTVTIDRHPDSTMRGHMDIQGSKFVRSSEDGGKVEGFIPNIWMNYRESYVGSEGIKRCGWTPIQHMMGNSSLWKAFLDQAWDHGCNGVQILPQRDMLDGDNPDIEDFRAMESAIIEAHKRKMFVHIFMWGDAQRGWNPPDGLNSPTDKRLNRYIAARLGALPGWYISLGFDLMEWAAGGHAQEWAEHLHDKMGWFHPLGARKEGSFRADLDIFSTDYRISEEWFAGTRDQFANGNGKPVEYSRRFSYLRDGVWSMQATREAFWGFAMAGGAASIWGHYPDDGCSAGTGGKDYPDPGHLRTHRRFWEHRFRTDFEPGDKLNDVIVMKNTSASHWVLYGEGTSVIDVDLSAMDGPQKAVAVDCKAEYLEIDAGTLSAENQTISLPHSSDWAIAVGDFGQVNDATYHRHHDSGGQNVVTTRSGPTLNVRKLTISVQAHGPYRLKILQADGRVVSSHTGHGPQRIALDKNSTPNGVLLVVLHEENGVSMTKALLYY